MKILHTSVSRTENYIRCPQSYKYRYHLDIIPETTPFHFTFGKIVHKIIEVYTLNRGKKSINEVQKEVLDGTIPYEEGKTIPNLDNLVKQRLNAHVHNFMRLADKIGTDGEVEWPFDIDLDPPGGKKWVGFIDRMIVKKDHVFIIDYKTTRKGKWRKNHNTIKKDLQIQGYCYVAANHFKLPAANVRAALYYLEDATLVDSGCFDEEVLQSVPKNLLNIYNTIQSHDPDKVVGKTGDHCRNCDYSDICPFYKEYKTGLRRF